LDSETSITSIDMPQFSPTHPRTAPHPALPCLTALSSVLWLLAMSSCGDVTCPEPLSNVDGTCEKLDPIAAGEPEADAERCDGLDNDGDDKIDEDWPELGEGCGGRDGVGECVQGQYVCTEDGRGVVCEGAVGPSDEVCDGKDNDCDGVQDNGPEETCDGEDNDCDGLVDEGVLSIKGEVFDDHATVTAVDGGFVVTRIIADRVRIETYDHTGSRTGHHDEIDASSETQFLVSDAFDRRVLVGLGKYSFHVVEAHVDSDLIPIVTDSQALHDDWRQGMTLGVYDPPYHPRVAASPSRFLGYRDVITFALNPFSDDNLVGLAQEPTLAMELPLYAVFDVAGPFVMWEEGDKVRAALLLNDGSFLLDLDVARGTTPSIAIGKDGPGVAYLQDGTLRLSELHRWTLQCVQGRFCNQLIEGEHEDPSGPIELAYDEANDTWFVVAGTELIVVSRGDGGPVTKQALVRDLLGEAPNRVDVAVSGNSAAVVQAAKNGRSALTFLGCF
jgi:hypothetical protein